MRSENLVKQARPGPRLRRKVSEVPQKTNFESKLRLFIYRYFIRHGRAPLVAEMAEGLSLPIKQMKAALLGLVETHAFLLQESGELWRAAPFSAVPTSFPVKIASRSWYGNCIWDALGIAAMLHKDALIQASCGCCNFEMVLTVRGGRLLRHEGIAHFAVPARDWYRDVVFT
jgi:hypothetical protein